jgi:hypothetical protein
MLLHEKMIRVHMQYVKSADRNNAAVRSTRRFSNVSLCLMPIATDSVSVAMFVLNR